MNLQALSPTFRGLVDLDADELEVVELGVAVMEEEGDWPELEIFGKRAEAAMRAYKDFLVSVEIEYTMIGQLAVMLYVYEEGRSRELVSSETLFDYGKHAAETRDVVLRGRIGGELTEVNVRIASAENPDSDHYDVDQEKSRVKIVDVKLYVRKSEL